MLGRRRKRIRRSGRRKSQSQLRGRHLPFHSLVSTHAARIQVRAVAAVAAAAAAKHASKQTNLRSLIRHTPIHWHMDTRPSCIGQPEKASNVSLRARRPLTLRSMPAYLLACLHCLHCCLLYDYDYDTGVVGSLQSVPN